MIYQVKLKDDIWYIEGASKLHIFFGIHGGGPFIKIDKIKGTILDISHTGLKNSYSTVLGLTDTKFEEKKQIQ